MLVPAGAAGQPIWLFVASVEAKSALPAGNPLLLSTCATRSAPCSGVRLGAAAALGAGAGFAADGGCGGAFGEDLHGRVVDCSRDGFALAMDVSVYSFTALARAALPIMKPSGAMMTMTYIGSQRARGKVVVILD